MSLGKVDLKTKNSRALEEITGLSLFQIHVK